MIHSTVINDCYSQTIHISVDHITPKRHDRKFVTPNNFKEQWFPKIKFKPSNSTMLTKEIEILSRLNTENQSLKNQHVVTTLPKTSNAIEHNLTIKVTSTHS